MGTEFHAGLCATVPCRPSAASACRCICLSAMCLGSRYIWLFGKTLSQGSRGASMIPTLSTSPPYCSVEISFAAFDIDIIDLPSDAAGGRHACSSVSFDQQSLLSSEIAAHVFIQSWQCPCCVDAECNSGFWSCGHGQQGCLCLLFSSIHALAACRPRCILASAAINGHACEISCVAFPASLMP